MFTVEDRERIREELMDAARASGVIVGAALVGSAARGAEDAWSDIDLALQLAPDAAEPAAPVVAAAPPGSKRAGRADKKSAAAASAPSARGAPTKAEVRERLLAAIAELETCRGILLGNSPETAARRPAQKARRSARA